ncbi:hypothetical protein C9J03_02180 [Photobacterium gaetbulicola]|uniref:SWIM-type domain-containing protein n=1 Tax=Photobacterium gaetbulicola Gung47 TaxID=658445 RepID=A0A0C5WSS6_9GAMM|nr:SWIM zinc finger family protein [Photobacterium gaetbulicola]AJR09457.1 hypothetical protein H744_2c2804 [Photobacterium gaetbulicola Gung47]PSU14256.1 hypothetical protein C9J03_02180 [Photobacterium gaetbulicola]
MGTKPYSVVVSYTDGDFFSSCTCPAAEYQTVCKHAVATALTLWGEVAVEKDSSEHLRDSSPKQVPSLRDWLAGKEVSELVDITLSLIEADPDTYDLWWQRAQMAHSPLSVKELKKQITKALPRRSIWEPDKVERYFERALESLRVLNEGIVQLSADQQMALLEYAESRLYTVLLNMDDSYGYRLDLEQCLNGWLKAGFAKVSWSDKQKGAWLFHQFKAEFTVLDIPEDFDFDPAALEQFYYHCEMAIELDSEPRDKQR